MNHTHPAIAIHNLHFTRPEGFTLSIPDLAIMPGSFVGIMGLNGSGKTSLLACMAKLLPFAGGDIFIHGINSKKLQPQDIARMIAVVEQETQYVFPYTVLEVVLMGRYAHQQGNFFETDAAIQKAWWALEKTDMKQFAHRLVSHLSGGERRRVEIARALCQDTNILMLDEPTAFLDFVQQRSLMKLLRDLNTREQKTIIFVTHQISLIQEYGNRLLVVDRGTLTLDTADLQNCTEEYLTHHFS